MNNLIAQSTNDFIFALAWTLLHSVWQFAIIVLLFLGLSRFTKNAALKYQLALGSLLICLMISLVTFYHYYSNILDLRQLMDLSSWNLDNQKSKDFLQMTIVLFNDNIHLVIGLWIAGFSIHLLGAVVDYLACRKLVKFQTLDLDEQWLTKFVDLQKLIGINKKISYKLSQLINSPCVVGVFKPVILIPPALLLNLSQAQIEAVMLHELAHVRRNDYLINILQCIAKGIFFFNPFFIYLSRIIDQERENSCDDLAVYYSGNAMEYSKGISALAELNISSQLALAANSKSYSILPRIKRLFGDNSAEKNTTFQLLCSTLIGLLGLILATNVYALPAKFQESHKLEINQATESQNALPAASSTAEVAEERATELQAAPTEKEPPSSIVTAAVADYVQETSKKKLSDSTKEIEKTQALKKFEEEAKAKPLEVLKFQEPPQAQVETTKPVIDERTPSSNMDKFSAWKDSQFPIFLVNNDVNFSEYDRVIVVPTPEGYLWAHEEINDTENSSMMTSFKQRLKLSMKLGFAAKRKLTQSKYFKVMGPVGRHVEKNNTFAVQIKLKELPPSVASQNSHKEVLLGLSVIIVDTRSEEVIAYIEEEIKVSTRLEYFPKGENLADMRAEIDGETLSWNQVSLLFADRLFKDLHRLKQG